MRQLQGALINNNPLEYFAELLEILASLRKILRYLFYLICADGFSCIYLYCDAA